MTQPTICNSVGLLLISEACRMQARRLANIWTRGWAANALTPPLADTSSISISTSSNAVDAVGAFSSSASLLDRTRRSFRRPPRFSRFERPFRRPLEAKRKSGRADQIPRVKTTSKQLKLTIGAGCGLRIHVDIFVLRIFRLNSFELFKKSLLCRRGLK